MACDAMFPIRCNFAESDIAEPCPKTAYGTRTKHKNNSSYKTSTPNNHNIWNSCIADRGPSNAPGNST